MDLLDYISPSAFDPKTHHLEGNHNPLYVLITPARDKFYWIKGPKGYPWDIQLVDDRFVYLWITESVWGDPRTYKKFVRNGWPGEGLPLAPRTIGYGLPSPEVISVQSAFQTVANCTQVKLSDLGAVRTTLTGPYLIDFKGDVAQQPALIANYQWNGEGGKYSDREQFFLTSSHGLVRWTHAKLDGPTGMYVEDNQTDYNRVVVGGAPVPFFPCF